MDRAVPILMILGALCVVLYWIDFFVRGDVHVIEDDYYIKFERSFFLADFWMSFCAVIGGIGLLMNHHYGLLFSLLAAGSLIFLGLLDMTFNIQNKLYRLIATSKEMKIEVFINIVSLVFGTIIILHIISKYELMIGK